MNATTTQESLSPKLNLLVEDSVAATRLSLYRAISQQRESVASRIAMPAKADSLEQLFTKYLKLPYVAGSVRIAANAGVPPVPTGIILEDPAPLLDQLARSREASRFGFSV